MSLVVEAPSRAERSGVIVNPSDVRNVKHREGVSSEAVYRFGVVRATDRSRLPVVQIRDGKHIISGGQITSVGVGVISTDTSDKPFDVVIERSCWCGFC